MFNKSNRIHVHNCFLFSAFILGVMSGLGITAGAHRLWTHRTYKAKLPLRVLLTALNTIAFQYSVIEWARDHRVHHKYCDTNADPHNPSRYCRNSPTDLYALFIYIYFFFFLVCSGFFYAHVGWMLCARHPEAIAKCNEMDMTDLENDPMLSFQKK